MHPILSLFCIFLLAACSGQRTPPDPVVSNRAARPQVAIDTPAEDAPQVRHSPEEQGRFLDSVSGLDPARLGNPLAAAVDSVFRSAKSLSDTLSAADLRTIRAAARTGALRLDDARRLLPGFVDSAYRSGEYDGQVPLRYLPLSKEDPGFFALAVGSHMDWSSPLYFFRHDRLIARHDVRHRYGLKLRSFRDADGGTVLYYIANFESGSGIWENHYFFYKLLGDRLVPVLQTIEDNNFTWPGPRHFRVESVVRSERPLRIRYIYGVGFPSGSDGKVLDDSTEVTYRYDAASRTYRGQFGGTRLDDQKLRAYSLYHDELPFVHAYAAELRAWLGGPDSARRAGTAHYLDAVMHLHRR